MLEMIQFGAEKMFRSKDATITDADIDTLLAHGEKKTAEGLAKLKSLGDEESLQSFTFDTKPEKSMMEFEGQDFAKAPNAFNWIAPPKRDRKVRVGLTCTSVPKNIELSITDCYPRPPTLISSGPLWSEQILYRHYEAGSLANREGTASTKAAQGG